MITTELRAIADALEIDCIARCADEIDRLRTEAVAADIRISNDGQTIARLTAERDAALASEAVYKQLCEEAKPLIAQNIVLRAERAALAAQEPVGWARDDTHTFMRVKKESPYFPVYATAGAAPVPVGDCNTCAYETRAFTSEPCVTCSRLRDYTYNYVPKEPT